MIIPWEQLPEITPFKPESEQAFITRPHGDWPEMEEILRQLSQIEFIHRQTILDSDTVQALGVCPQEDTLKQLLLALHPWRKGPWQIAGINIDTEWRSDFKWNRLFPFIKNEIKNARVLDIGCGSGYHLCRMAGAGARFALGIEPYWRSFAQFWAVRRFLGNIPAAVLPLAIEEFPSERCKFDMIFSMGVIYHRKNPQEHLNGIFNMLAPGGTAVVETLIATGNDPLIINGRYAKMRNVHEIPSIPGMIGKLSRAGFTEVSSVNVAATTCEEQRSTPWMSYQSLRDFLDPDDPGRTVEGFPAPVRAVFIGRKK